MASTIFNSVTNYQRRLKTHSKPRNSSCPWTIVPRRSPDLNLPPEDLEARWVRGTILRTWTWRKKSEVRGKVSTHFSWRKNYLGWKCDSSIFSTYFNLSWYWINSWRNHKWGEVLEKKHHKTSFDEFMKKPLLQYRPLSANPNHATQENE